MGAALLISAGAFALGALCAEGWGPRTVPYGDLYLLALLFGILGFAEILGKMFWHARWTGVTVSGTMSPQPPDTATLIYEVAEKGLSIQASQIQDLRTRATTLAAVGPAAALVIVTTNSAKFDLLASFAIVFLVLAVAMTAIVLQPPFKFNLAVVLEDDVPAGASPTVLKLALAMKMNLAREENSSRYKWTEGLFVGAATSFLVAVLLWAIHASTGSHVLFTLN